MAVSNLGNVLEEINLRQGNEVSVFVDFVDENGEPLDLRPAKTYLKICPFGNVEIPLLVKEGVVDVETTGRAVFKFTTEETKQFDGGKYEYEPTAIYDNNGIKQEFGEGRGVTFFTRRISDM